MSTGDQHDSHAAVGETNEYNLPAIRELLLNAFTDRELRSFCQVYPAFHGMIAKFRPGSSLEELVDDLITYCQTRLLWDELLDAVASERPRQYARFMPYRQAAAPPTSADGKAAGFLSAIPIIRAAPRWAWLVGLLLAAFVAAISLIPGGTRSGTPEAVSTATEQPASIGTEEHLRRCTKLLESGVKLRSAGIMDEAESMLYKAIAECRAVLDVDSKNCTAWHNLGVAYSAVGQPGQAMDSLIDALECAPGAEDPDTYYELGTVSLQLSHPGQARDYCRKALDIDPQSAEAHYCLGIASFQLEDLDQALSSLQAFSQLELAKPETQQDQLAVQQANAYLVQLMPGSVVVTPTPLPYQPPSSVRVLKVDAVGNAQAESVIVTNETGQVVDLQGWTISDESGNTYTFADVRLWPGGALTINTRIGENHTPAFNFYWGKQAPIWAPGETAVLRDAEGGVIDSYTIDPTMADTEAPVFVLKSSGAQPNSEWTGFRGLVIDARGLPLEDVPVAVWFADGTLVAPVCRTDENGNYEIRLADAPLAGTWVIQVLTDDLQPASRLNSFVSDENSETGSQTFWISWQQVPEVKP